jgi:hypothetical protein
LYQLEQDYTTTHAAHFTFNSKLILVTLTVGCRRQPALSLIS